MNISFNTGYFSNLLQGLFSPSKSEGRSKPFMPTVTDYNRKINNDGQNFCREFKPVPVNFIDRYFFNPIKDFFNEKSIELGINRGSDDQRSGFFASTVDSFANTWLGRTFGISPSEEIQSNNAITQTAKAVSAKAVSEVNAKNTALDVPANSGSILGDIGSTIFNYGQQVYDFFKNVKNMDTKTTLMSGAVLGGTIGLQFGGPIGAGIGALIGAAAGGLSKLFGSKKPKDQKERDQMRKMLIQNGIMAPDYTMQLADGSKFYMGTDGKARAEWGGRKFFEPDPSNQLEMQTYNTFLQVTSKLMQGSENLSTAFAGYLTKATLSNANNDPKIIEQNMKALLIQLGIK